MSVDAMEEAVTPVPTALILTALPEELVAVLKLLGHHEKKVEAGFHFYIGSYAGWRIITARSGKGNSAAADLTRLSTGHFMPQVALFVGIAGGRKDVTLGDVVVGERLSNFEIGKESAEGFLPRSYEQPGSHRLVEIGKDIELNCLMSDPPDGLSEGAKIIVGHITSGSKTLAIDTGSIAETLNAHFDDANAVEQEGHGFLSVAIKTETVPAVVIRGISDMRVGKSETDALGWQETAARNAAVVALAILAAFPKPEPPPGFATAPRIAELSEAQGGTCALSGTLGAKDIASLWEGPPPIDVLRLRLSDRAAPLALRQALLRVLCHVPDVSPLAIEVAPGSGWPGRYSDLVGRPTGASFSGWQPEWREASAPGATPPGDVVVMADLAETLHAAMDEWAFDNLDTAIQDTLTSTPGMAHRIIVEEVLGDELLGLWRMWRQDMDEATRARFMALLVTLREDIPLPRDVAIGRRMIAGMADGAVLALALAHCGGFAASVAGHPGLCPCADSPGNLAAETLRCHSTGVQHWKDKRVGHLRISDLEGVRARLLLLAQHEGEFRFEVATQRALGAASVSTSLGSNSLSRPAVLTYDGDFAEALKEGKASVERYLRKRLLEESLPGQAILDALEKSA